jgi:hypothetical protein
MKHMLKKWLSACFVGVFLASLLATPAFMGIFSTHQPAHENRNLASFPPKPKTPEQWFSFTSKLDLWINDHFGFRELLIRLNNNLRFVLFDQFPTTQVISGRSGRIFLSAHDKASPLYSAITTPCGYAHGDIDVVAQQVGKFISSFQSSGISAKLMIVPSAPMVYPEHLPAWLEKRCSSVASPIELLLGSKPLRAFARSEIYHPKEEMLSLKESLQVFPKNWFHWGGDGPRAVVDLSVNRLWSIPSESGKALVATRLPTDSDIAYLFPGIQLKSEVLAADYKRSGIQECLGAPCFPELEKISNKLQEVARYTNPAAPAGKLIVLSDSFGKYAAGWYSRYFREVKHFSTNSLPQLDVEEARAFRNYVLNEARGTHLLLLYHDGAVMTYRLALDQSKLFE